MGNNKVENIWTKKVRMTDEIEKFTIGRDREMDLYLAKYDVLGSMAHITMLQSIGLLTAEELDVLLKELRTIYEQAEKGEFVIEEGVEDVHSQVELMLTRKLGDIGKKSTVVVPGMTRCWWISSSLSVTRFVRLPNLPSNSSTN